jgi:squalene synthase HpnC
MSIDVRIMPTELPDRSTVMAQATTENFPVAALALGRHRRHLLAIYGFARLVDDVGDEAPGDRLAQLEEIEHQLRVIYAGGEPAHPVMRTLAPVVVECALPSEPFHRLIEANRQDQSVTRYETFAQLLDYCHLSAAPVGELVLRAFGELTPARLAMSDQVCAALQLIEHLQDVGEDYARGRVYLPREQLAKAGCAEDELAAATASPALREVIAAMARHSRELLAAGPTLARQLAPRPRLAVTGFVAGGRAALAAIDHADYDVLGRRPRPSRSRLVTALVRVGSGR